MSTGTNPKSVKLCFKPSSPPQHSEVSPFPPFPWSCLKSDGMAHQLGPAGCAFHKYCVFIKSLATNAKAHVGPGPAWFGAGGAGGRTVLGPPSVRLSVEHRGATRSVVRSSL